MIQEFEGKKPQVHETVFVAATAEVIGDAVIGEGSSVWPGAVIRGDLAPIRIGENSSMQDNCVIHGDPGILTTIKDFVSIGHGAIVHGATVGSNCIIGMGSILLNGCDIGENSIVGAGAVVKEGEKIPPKSLAVGIPAKVVRSLTEEDIQKIRQNALEYVELAKKHRGLFGQKR